MNEGIQIFLSYAHNDESLAREILNHLTSLRKQGSVTVWSTDKLLPGQKLEEAISDHLDSSQIILLLVSSDFLASKEFSLIVPKAMKRQEAGEAKVIPIILRPVDWQETSFSKLQVLPKDGRALALWANRDLAYLDIAEAIIGVVTNLTSLTKNQGDEVRLQKTLKTFSERELRLLCFDIGLPTSIFLNDTQEEVVDALLAYMKSQNRIQELAIYVRKKRPALS